MGMESNEELVENLLERLSRMEQLLDEIKELQEEVIEKLANLSLPGNDYSVDRD